MTHFNVRLVVEEITSKEVIAKAVYETKPGAHSSTRVRVLAEFKTTGESLDGAIKRAVNVLGLVEQ